MPVSRRCECATERAHPPQRAFELEVRQTADARHGARLRPARAQIRSPWRPDVVVARPLPQSPAIAADGEVRRDRTQAPCRRHPRRRWRIDRPRLDGVRGLRLQTGGCACKWQCGRHGSSLSNLERSRQQGHRSRTGREGRQSRCIALQPRRASEGLAAHEAWAKARAHSPHRSRRRRTPCANGRPCARPSCAGVQARGRSCRSFTRWLSCFMSETCVAGAGGISRGFGIPGGLLAISSSLRILHWASCVTVRVIA